MLTEIIFMNLDIATSCGLIANHLVSNTLKQALPELTNVTVSVECYEMGDREIHLWNAESGRSIN